MNVSEVPASRLIQAAVHQRGLSRVMPVYHFNVRDGANIPDPDGTELPDLRAARVEAVKLAGRLLMDEPDTFWEGSDWHLEVTDDSGIALFRLNFTATDAVTAAL